MMLRRLLAQLRRASDAVYRALLLVLLSVVYVTIIPWYALALRLRRKRATGWHRREDPDLATLPRLRSPF
jgi:hypothetical protein